ncbi:MAG TPA: hypothetical protein VKU01_26975 [Bryobacteraceae bacterium]|nr:hypothetical protein [Bryobacteraceae bacterium]
MRQLVFLAALAAFFTLRADIVTCHCDPTHPETLQARECSLCREAEKQAPGTEVFFLKDANPSKPNRWLALPRGHERSMDSLPADVRTRLLAEAAAKAKSLFGEKWAIAYNAPEVQTQCHVHVHIGRWMPQVENDQFTMVKRVEDVPAPRQHEGFWLHPVDGGFHLHAGELITETVLER